MPGSDLDVLGCALALLAGAFWAAYIVLSARVGRSFAGGQGLAMAMVVAGALLLGPGIADGGADLLDPALLAIAFAVAMLSSAIPYSLELEALRRLPQGTFGVLMSLGARGRRGDRLPDPRSGPGGPGGRGDLRSWWSPAPARCDGSAAGRGVIRPARRGPPLCRPLRLESLAAVEEDAVARDQAVADVVDAR